MIDRLANIKSWVKECVEENGALLFISTAIFLTAVLAIGIMRLSLLINNHTPILFTENTQTAELDYSVVASKNGTRYYYPWCGGVQRIKEHNKIWFKTKEAAQAVGLTLAAGCDAW